MRPHRNPISEEMVAENQVWLNEQFAVPEALRDQHRSIPDGFDWQWTADYQLDTGRVWVSPALRQGVRFVNPLQPPRARARDDEMPNNARIMKEFTALNLDKLQGPVILRDVKLPPFKIDYDSHEQIHQKLNNTVILIKNVPFLVRQTADLGKVGFGLLVQDKDGDNYKVLYNAVQDCRGIAPGYFMYRGQALWVYRVPERQNSQGMHPRNCQYKVAGTTHATGASATVLLHSLGQATDVQYASNLNDVLLGGMNQSMRLSNNIALYLTNKKGAPIGVEYCGRPLGLMVNGAIKVMDTNDLGPSWIHKDLHKVGLVMGE